MDSDERFAKVETRLDALKESFDKYSGKIDLFMSTLHNNYVPRREYEDVAKRVDELDKRFWGVTITVGIGLLWIVLK